MTDNMRRTDDEWQRKRFRHEIRAVLAREKTKTADRSGV